MGGDSEVIEEDEQLVETFVCPISQLVMQDPVCVCVCAYVCACVRVCVSV
jgi:hypothetical protein